jgi:hypothetical protein
VKYWPAISHRCNQTETTRARGWILHFLRWNLKTNVGFAKSPVGIWNPTQKKPRPTLNFENLRGICKIPHWNVKTNAGNVKSNAGFVHFFAGPSISPHARPFV